MIAMIARVVAVLATFAFLGTKAACINPPVLCPAKSLFINDETFWPTGFNTCPKEDHETSYPQDECCLAKCMEQLLAPDQNIDASFEVCRNSNSGGAHCALDWAEQYCDCPFKAYCQFVCNPSCETKKLSRSNPLAVKVQAAAFTAPKGNLSLSDKQVHLSLTHDSRNLCPVFIFAVFKTENQYAIVWDNSVLYKPYAIYEDQAYVCEDIVIEFSDENSPQCGPSNDIIELGEKQCGVRLPASFETFSQSGDAPNELAQYIAYSNCEFLSVAVEVKVDCH